MLIIRYFFSFTFLILAVYFGFKGLLFKLSDLEHRQSHKKRAIFYTIASICALISVEFYIPNIVNLICLPILLISIWLEYLIAILIVPKE